MHWRGRTRPRVPSDGGALGLKPGVNPQKSSTLRGACGSFPGQPRGSVVAALDYNTKRRPRPGLEPVGQRDHPRGVPARKPKSQETTNFDFLKVAPQSKRPVKRQSIIFARLKNPNYDLASKLSGLPFKAFECTTTGRKSCVRRWRCDKLTNFTPMRFGSYFADGLVRQNQYVDRRTV